MMATRLTAKQFHLLVPVGLMSLSIGGILAIAPAAFAQTNVDPVEELQSPQGNSGMFGGEGDAPNLMEMFHQINLQNPRTSEEYRQEQRENLSIEAENFRQQRDLLLQQSESDPTTEVAP